MSTWTNVEDIAAYVMAHQLAVQTCRLLQCKSFNRDFALKHQIQKSAVSIPSNIAEGFARQGNREFMQFLYIAKGSLAELHCQISISRELGLLSPTQTKELELNMVKLAGLLGGMIRHLHNSPIPGYKYRKQSDEIRASSHQSPPTENRKQKTVNRPASRAFALISVLLVLAVLVIMATAFMQSMRIDRLTARAYLNKVRAEMAAESALVAAVQKTVSALPTVTSTATANETTGFVTWCYSPNTSTFSPYFSGILPSPLGNTNSVDGTVWLFSTPTPGDTQSSSLGNQGPDYILTSESVADHNFNREIVDEATAYPASWIFLGNQTRGAASRFSFWGDDESARLNISEIGNTAGVLGNNGTLSDIPLFTRLPLAANLIPAEEAVNWFNFRGSMKFISTASIFQVTPSMKSLQSILTVDPDPSRSQIVPYGPKFGQPRKDINTLALNATNSAEAVGSLNAWVKEALPSYFARKEYVTGSVNRTAACIIDYIDADSNLTLSDDLRTVVPSTVSTPWNDYTSTRTYTGLEQVPRMNELLTYWGDGSLASPSFSKTPGRRGGITYTIGMTRVLELWNSYDKPITLPNLSVRFFNQARVLFGSATGAESSVPYRVHETLEISNTTITLNPNEFKALTVNSTYTIQMTDDFTWEQIRQNIPEQTTCGYVLFTSSGGGETLIDGFYPYEHQARPANSRAGSNPGYSGSGDTMDTRLNLGRYLSRWATVTSNGGHSPNAPNNLSGRLYQNMNTWFDRPLVGGPEGVSPTSPPNHHADSPMKSITELGNIFAPSRDLKEAGNRPRGGKTLVVGQFDPYQHYDLNGNVQNGLNNRQNYVRRADTVLADIFTVNATSNRININSPRPASLNMTAMDFLSARLSDRSPTDYIYPTSAPTYKTRFFNNSPGADQLRARLAVADWRAARPFLNAADLTLAGCNVQGSGLNAAESIWSNSSAWFAAAPPRQITADANGRQASVLDGRDATREAQFAAFADYVGFQSYRYRFSCLGEAVGPTGKTVSRHRIYAQLEIFPEYDPSSGSVRYRHQVTRLSE